MIKKTLFAAIAMTLTATLTAGAAQADENGLSKPAGAGMLTGAAAGAIVGGPVGALVGLMIGGIVGGSVEQVQSADRRAQVVENELLETRRELALVSRQAEELDGQEAGSQVMVAELAERLRADVLFRTNSVQLDAMAQQQLAQIGKLLAAHPRLAIHLHGFADPRGTPEQNLMLSLQRTSSVRDALVTGGATSEQIKSSAHGEDTVTAPQGDLEAYAWERRVSLVLQPVIQTGVPGQLAQSQVNQSR